jgi:transposase
VPLPDCAKVDNEVTTGNHKSVHTPTFNNYTKMEPPSTPPNLMPDHQLGFEIRTKHKEAIRQLHFLAHWGASALAKVYKTGRSTINRILKYDAPERARPTRTGRPRFLNHQHVLDIIEYISSSWEGRCLNYVQLKNELGIEASARTIERRLKEEGYYRYVACQKPYLTRIQAAQRWLYGL